MLKSIKVKNFKPFGDIASVRLAPITLVYGPNSSGKSSLIQSLLLMSQTLTGQRSGRLNDLITRGSLLDLGNFSSILHRHETKRLMQFEYEFDESASSGINSRLSRQIGSSPFPSVSLTFKARAISEQHVVPSLHAVGFEANGFDGKKFSFAIERPSGMSREFAEKELGGLDGYDDEELQELLGLNEQTSVEREGTYRFSSRSNLSELAHFIVQFDSESLVRRDQRRMAGMAYDQFDIRSIQQLLSKLRLRKDTRRLTVNDYLPTTPFIGEGGPGQISTRVHQAVADILRSYDRSLRKALGGLSYLGPLRTHPARHYLLDGVPGDSVGSRGEQSVQLLFHDSEARHGETSLLDRLNDYCKKFEIPYVFSLRNLGDAITGDLIVLSLTDTRTGVLVGPADVGFGIGQLLPILIEGILVNLRGPSSRIVCVEQPEIHLHPRLQAAMADFFIDTSQVGSPHWASRDKVRHGGGVQWIVETHSEALILRLQRRIRENKLSHDDVSVLYVDPRGKKGSVVLELRLDEAGEFIDLWPDGFFAESFSELMGGR